MRVRPIDERLRDVSCLGAIQVDITFTFIATALTRIAHSLANISMLWMEPRDRVTIFGYARCYFGL